MESPVPYTLLYALLIHWNFLAGLLFIPGRIWDDRINFRHVVFQLGDWIADCAVGWNGDIIKSLLGSVCVRKLSIDLTISNLSMLWILSEYSSVCISQSVVSFVSVCTSQFIVIFMSVWKALSSVSIKFVWTSLHVRITLSVWALQSTINLKSVCVQSSTSSTISVRVQLSIVWQDMSRVGFSSFKLLQAVLFHLMEQFWTTHCF